MRALGVDYGRKRIGLALSDATGLLARPWKTLQARGGVGAIVADLTREVDLLLAEPDGLAVIVLGFPRRLSGEPTSETRAVEQLAGALRAARPLPVVLQDERLSSHEADLRLAQREKDWRRRKPLVDAMAAAVVLQDYLDTRPHAASPASS